MVVISAPRSDFIACLHERLSAALAGDVRALAALEAESLSVREAALRDLEASGDRESLAAELLLSSLVAWRLGRSSAAKSTALEAWRLIQDRVPMASQALVLTQLGAALEIGQDYRAALRAVRRAEALLAAADGEALPQMLVVREQLVRLTRRANFDPSDVISRRDRALARLEREAIVPGGPHGVRCLVQAFVDRDDAPHWALVHHLRWANVFPR